jgi:hypothetical protein
MRVAARVFTALAMGAVALTAGSVSAQACNADIHYTYNEPVEIEGVLKSGTGHHEAQGDFTYTYLVLDKGVCVDAPKDGGDDDFGNTGTENPVERIQIGQGHALWRPHRVARRGGADRRALGRAQVALLRLPPRKFRL